MEHLVKLAPIFEAAVKAEEEAKAAEAAVVEAKAAVVAAEAAAKAKREEAEILDYEAYLEEEYLEAAYWAAHPEA